MNNYSKIKKLSIPNINKDGLSNKKFIFFPCYCYYRTKFRNINVFYERILLYEYSGLNLPKSVQIR